MVAKFCSQGFQKVSRHIKNRCDQSTVFSERYNYAFYPYYISSLWYIALLARKYLEKIIQEDIWSIKKWYKEGSSLVV